MRIEVDSNHVQLTDSNGGMGPGNRIHPSLKVQFIHITIHQVQLGSVHMRDLDSFRRERNLKTRSGLVTFQNGKCVLSVSQQIANGVDDSIAACRIGACRPSADTSL